MTLDGCKLKFVAQFKYLGHLISNSFSDDLDINRKIKALFTRMKIKLFRFYCICLYNAVLWSNLSVGAMNSLASSYVRCMKSFFGYSISAASLAYYLSWAFLALIHCCITIQWDCFS